MTPDGKPILSYAEEERIRTALASIANSDRRGAPAHVEAALVAALRRRQRQGTLLRLAVAGAIAATVLFGLLRTKPVVPASAVVPEVAEAVQPPARQPAPVITATAVPRPAVRRRAPQPAPRRQKPVETAEFIPVGAWQAYEPMERGAIVRVRLPKSSLPGFGIPVSADRWNESIPADVVLGEDGSMRAIRLVSNVE